MACIAVGGASIAVTAFPQSIRETRTSAVVELYQLPAYMPTSPAGTLRQAIFDSNAAGGNNVTLDAINAGRAIFVQAGNLTINNAVAQGGAGGNGASVAGNLNSGGGGGGGTDNHAINVGLRFSW
jgi:hypothetical protein